MANREFIAAKDLPEIEADTVDVLCVNPETGEMGKKSGAALGGGSGSSEPDMVIATTTDLLSATPSDMEILSGSAENVVAKLRANQPVDVCLVGITNYGSYGGVPSVTHSVTVHAISDNDIYINFIIIQSGIENIVKAYTVGVVSTRVSAVLNRV